MATFASDLLDWYAEHRRVLPWREENTPYRVFVSEFMLQQTRVDTVIPYFESFLRRFPDFQSLANAEESEVLNAWQGLGYYSRARNLLASAHRVCDVYGGELPHEEQELLTLPGVGEYMSRAILSIAYDEPFAAVDGNLLRVYARLQGLKTIPSSPNEKKVCGDFFVSVMDHPSSFNQALMDLGELVCPPHGAPLCSSCPLAAYCKSHERGAVEPLRPKPKPHVKRIHLNIALVFNEKGEIAVRRRAANGLLAGMHEFPNWEEGETPTVNLPLTLVGKAKHRFSHLEWTMDVYRGEGIIPGCEYVPFGEIKSRCSLPTAFAKLLELL